MTLPGRGYKFAATVRTVTEHGETLVAQARTRTQIVIEQEQPEEAASPIPIPQSSRRRKLLLLVGTAVLLLVFGALFILRNHRPAHLGEKDSILVADFTNTTGDPVFDGTLRQGLAIQLEQSPFLRIMDDAQMQRDLRLMSLDPGTRITPPIAHDVCVREGGAAAIDGAIARLGRSYVITLQAIACQEGATLAREQIEATDICMDRLSEANQLAAKVRAQGIDGSRIHQRLLEMAYVEDDKAAAVREIQWFAGKPEEYLSFGLQAANLNVHGQRSESHKGYQRAAQAALRLGFRYVADEFEEADARADALSGNCQTVRRLGRPALALAICGETARAEKLAAETSRRLPNGTIWNAVQLPEIEAMIALQSGQAVRSVELLASASPYERSYLDAVYVRGLAYLKMHRGADAAAEFKKIMDHKGANWGATWIHPNWGQYYSLSYVGMARGLVLAGQPANAKRAFERFFALWKNADRDIPILKLAQAEYARLN